MPSAPFERLTRCRICGSDALVVFLSLGETPLANAFIRADPPEGPELRVPLEVMRCERCGLAQLTVVVDPEIMFRDYAYATSASAPMRGHFEGLAAELVSRYAPAGSFVVEVGSNDGVLLRPLKARGVDAVGVEPAANLAAAAIANGLDTRNVFFDPGVASRLRAERGPARAVVANNVLAHIADLPGIARALEVLLEPDGVFVAEVPYLFDLLDHVEYDTIYHEHLSYFHLSPLSALFAQVGMELFDVTRLATHGGSVRIHVGRVGRRPKTAAVRELMAFERARLIDPEATFSSFVGRVEAQRSELRQVLDDMRSRGIRVAGYGATAKGNTMLNFCGIGPELVEFVADTTPYKQGLLTPGTHIPVRPESAIDEEGIKVLLLLAWNYADSIVGRMHDYVGRGGRFIHPIPLPRLLPA